MCGSGHKEGENIDIKVLGKIGVCVCECERERGRERERESAQRGRDVDEG